LRDTIASLTRRLARTISTGQVRKQNTICKGVWTDAFRESPRAAVGATGYLGHQPSINRRGFDIVTSRSECSLSLD
jgi:hypothetical protein